MPELARLENYLNLALAGQGQVCFLVGEAGTGKSVLAEEFCRQAQARDQSLVVATGLCDAQTGVGDPYLPFREVMAMLTGSVESEAARGRLSEENARRLREVMAVAAETLVEYGPDLIDVLVPGATLVAKLGKIFADKTELARRVQQRLAPTDRQVAGRAVDQGEILEQCGNVLRQLSRHRPLLIILDDLHWADNGSIDLLFRLGRRLGGSRLMVLGTFRPEEITIGRGGQRHPLEKLRSEFKRYMGDLEINLDQTVDYRGREFVDTYLSMEKNRLSDAFHDALFRHTGGHPLFTVELLRTMQERGDLVQTADGYWREGPQLDWAGLPARVEGVVAERIERLPEDLQYHLTIASVEGEQFTAEVIAQVGDQEARSVVQDLSGELRGEHKLVESQGVQRLGRQRLSRYRFTHNLMQQYIYRHLDEVQLSYLHEDVGHALEALYGDQADEIAPQLARHFLLSELIDKSRHYLRRAGEMAAARFANSEAVGFLSRALELTPATDAEERYALLATRERVYELLGDREAQEQDLVALEALATLLDGPGSSNRQAQMAVRRSELANALGDLAQAEKAGRRALELAERDQDAVRAAAHMALGRAMVQQGDYGGARAEFEEALRLAKRHGDRELVASSTRNLGLALYRLGEFDAARASLAEAATISGEVGDPRGEASAINILGAVAYALGDMGDVLTYFERSLQIYRQVGARQGEGMPLTNLGIMALYLGDYALAQQRFTETLQLQREIGDRNGEAISLFRLGQVASDQSQYAEAVTWMEKSLTLRQMMGDRDGTAESMAGLAHALLGLDRLAEAEALFEAAIALRGELGQPGLALAPRVGLARVWWQETPDRPDRVRDLIEPVIESLLRGATDGIAEPHRLCYDCYRLLLAFGDDRATELLARAARSLQASAAKINDLELRQAYLEHVPANRQILAALAAVTARGEAVTEVRGPNGPGAPAQAPDAPRVDEGG